MYLTPTNKLKALLLRTVNRGLQCAIHEIFINYSNNQIFSNFANLSLIILAYNNPRE